MIAIIIAALVAAAGGIATYLFRKTIGASLFSKPDPTQAAIDTQRAMGEDAANPPDRKTLSKDLGDGTF